MKCSGASIYPRSEDRLCATCAWLRPQRHRMTHVRWRFARMMPAEINQDPRQGEFSREVDLAGRFVREPMRHDPNVYGKALA